MNLAEKTGIETQALDRAKRDLASHGISCSLIRRTENSRGMLEGRYAGEPFAVYVSFLGKGSDGVGILVTRYKGKDWWNMEPYRLLKREG